MATSEPDATAGNHAYVVCGCKSWNRRVFDERIATLPGQWHYIGAKEDLTLQTLEQLRPQRMFFLHWSWRVPDAILAQYECINFHLTDVPYGRGGTPLQNLILRGHTTTKLSALRMTGEMDAGPVYLKEEMSLDGTAREILERESVLAVTMIRRIITEHPTPKEQKGEVVSFERRTPEQSAIPPNLSPPQLYDFIRMLDGEGYPAAFLDVGGFRHEFRGAILYDGRLEAHVKIVPLPPSS